MYVADISLQTEETIFRIAPCFRSHILDPSLYKAITKLNEFKNEFDVAMRVDLEIRLLTEIMSEKEPAIFKVKRPYLISTFETLNTEVIKYEHAFIIKPFLSNPMDMTFYVFCYDKREIDKPEVYRDAINNVIKIKKFLYMVAANGENILMNKHNPSFMKKRMNYISLFQSALLEKYERNKK